MKSRAFLVLAIFLAPFALGQMWEATRIGQQQWELQDDAGGHISWHQTGEEANEKGQKWSLEHDLRSFVTRHAGTRWDATAFAQSYPGAMTSTSPTEEPPNDPPVWNNTPMPSFTNGTAASYNLLDDVTDPESDTLTFVEETGCTYPTGVTLDNPNKELDYDGAGAVASASGCILSADDSTNTKVNSPAFTVQIVASGAADFTICATGCDYTTINDAALVANPGEIFEIRADTGGGTKTFGETIDWPSGTAGNYIEFVGRSGDTIIVTETSAATDRTTVLLTNHSYLKLKDMQIGDGIGWHPADPTPRQQNQYRQLDCNNSHHIWLDGLIVKGSANYTSVRIENTCDHFIVENITAEEHGSNAHQSVTNPNDTGNLWRDEGSNMYYRNNTWRLGGHNVRILGGNFQREEDSIYDAGLWEAALIADGLDSGEAANFPGTRAFIFNSGRADQGGTAPWGHVSMTRNIIKNSGASQNGGVGVPNPVYKIQGSFLQFYDNLVIDNSDGRIAARTRDGQSGLEASGNRVFHNTHYALDSFGDSRDNNNADTRSMYDNIFKNNIYDQMGNAELTFFVLKDTGKMQTTFNNFTINNGWLDDTWDNNLWNLLAGNMVIKVFENGASTSKTGITAIEAEWANWLNNDDTVTITYVNAAARTRAGFVCSSGDCNGTAVALTTMDGAGVTTTAGTFDDPLYFFTAEAYDIDSADAHWGSEGPVNDCVKIGASAAVRLSTINYTTGAMTLAAARSWSDADDVFMVKADDCTTVFDDIGIKE